MKKILACLFLTGLFLTACGETATKSSESTKPSDKILDDNIFSEATGSGNLTRCKDILDTTLKTSCEQVINDNKATAAAITDLDKSKCGKVSDSRYKKECEIQVAAKLEAKNAEAKRLSIAQKATDNGDAALCNEIKDENQKASCKYNILYNQAKQKKDPSICKGIGLKDMIEECKRNLAKVK